jgi:hypothetical protein
LEKKMETEPTPTAKPKRARKPSKPRAPRVKDEGILAIEREAADKKAQYRLAQQSGGVLKRIVDKMLPRLTPGDRQKLFDALGATETPALSSAMLSPTPITQMPSAALTKEARSAGLD